MSELFETIEMNANAAKAREAEAAEAAQKIRDDLQAASLAAKKQAAQLRQKKARRALLFRTFACAVAIAGLRVASTCDLMAVQLCRPLAAAVLVYLAFWFGAWCQFAWCKGGLLE